MNCTSHKRNGPCSCFCSSTNLHTNSNNRGRLFVASAKSRQAKVGGNSHNCQHTSFAAK